MFRIRRTGAVREMSGETCKSDEMTGRCRSLQDADSR